MRHGVLIVLLSVFIAALLLDIAVRVASAGATQRAEIVMDEEGGVIHFMLDRREIAWLDAGGFSVRGDVTYSGALTDTGDPEFKANENGGRDAP